MSKRDAKHPLHMEPTPTILEAIHLLAELDRRIDGARRLLGTCLPLRAELADYIDLALQRQLGITSPKEN